VKKLKNSAKLKFKNGEYKMAFEIFTKIIELDPFDTEAKISLLLCDYAIDNEEDANLLFELYNSAKSNNIGFSDELFEKLLQDTKVNLSQKSIVDNIFIDDSNIIEYKDFKQLVIDRGSFKVAFEDMIFSVKVVIDNKDDFIDFITQLLDNGYKNSALNYLESAALLFPHEEFFHKTIENFKA